MIYRFLSIPLQKTQDCRKRYEKPLYQFIPGPEGWEHGKVYVYVFSSLKLKKERL